MNTKDVIYELRTRNGMSQDELAEKIFVTRQAVSRWENGDTVPNTEALKLLSNLFNVSINTLLGSPRQLICQCCGMPLDDTIIGTDKDGALNENYCKWCYADGQYTYSDMDELIDVCVKNMVSEQFTEEQARAYLKQTLPQLDYWKRYEQLSDNGESEASSISPIPCRAVSALSSSTTTRPISATSLSRSSAANAALAF